MDDQRDEGLKPIAEALGQNGPALAEAWSKVFGDAPAFGQPALSSLADVSPPLTCPGLLLELAPEDSGVVAVIPASAALPDWCSAPDAAQAGGLQEFAAACSALIAPEAASDLPADSAAVWVEDLHAAITERAGDRHLQCCQLSAAQTAGEVDGATAEEDGTEEASATVESGEDGALLRVIFLQAAPPAQSPESTTPEVADGKIEEPPASGASATQIAEPASGPDHRTQLGGKDCSRIRGVPVTVSVRLAEKKVPLKQLMTISPGALLTFNKSCEDLLDLYVNNVPFCRGEAVKVGEKFGLKINEIGRTELAASRPRK